MHPCPRRKKRKDAKGKEHNTNEKNTKHINVGRNAVQGSSHMLHDFKFHAMDSYRTGPAVVIISAQLIRGYIENIKKAVEVVMLEPDDELKRLGTKGDGVSI